MPDAPSATRFTAELVAQQGIAMSRDEGYGDCPHGPVDNCEACEAHIVVDALIKAGFIDA